MESLAKHTTRTLQRDSQRGRKLSLLLPPDAQQVMLLFLRRRGWLYNTSSPPPSFNNLASLSHHSNISVLPIDIPWWRDHVQRFGENYNRVTVKSKNPSVHRSPKTYQLRFLHNHTTTISKHMDCRPPSVQSNRATYFCNFGLWPISSPNIVRIFIFSKTKTSWPCSLRRTVFVSTS